MAENMELLSALEELERSKGISKEELIVSIEEAVARAYNKMFANGYTINVIFDREDGSIHLYRTMLVVEEVENPESELELSEAQKIDPLCGIDDVIETGEIFVDNFNYTAALEARQTILQRIREAEKRIIAQEYKEGDIITATVSCVTDKCVYFDLDRVSAVMPKSETVEDEMRTRYIVGTRLKLCVCRVEDKKGISIVVSRKRKELISALLELEVPEIASGLVEIKGIVREPGKRTKVAVASRDPQIDPVGTCVGQHGDRIKRIVDELSGNERIDVIRWSMNIETYVMNALSPANILYVRIEERKVAKKANLELDPMNEFTTAVDDTDDDAFSMKKVAVVYVGSVDDMKLAIGKNRGQNVRLAGWLTGITIEVKIQPPLGESEAMNAEEGATIDIDSFGNTEEE